MVDMLDYMSVKTIRNDWVLLTNFDDNRLACFKIAIELYTGPYQLEIQSASNHYCDWGLWYKLGGSASKDLSDFWAIYDVIRL